MGEHAEPAEVDGEPGLRIGDQLYKIKHDRRPWKELSEQEKADHIRAGVEFICGTPRDDTHVVDTTPPGLVLNSTVLFQVPVKTSEGLEVPKGAEGFVVARSGPDEYMFAVSFPDPALVSGRRFDVCTAREDQVAPKDACFWALCGNLQLPGVTYCSAHRAHYEGP